ncbi:MAG: SUMF1/EgtB/PvdO family nonheme iron enzyme [Myxococcota bacterium]
MCNRVRSSWLPLAAAILLLAPPAAAVTIDWVTVGAAGNAADTTGFGSVADVYRISKTEITNAQYAEFLNKVAATDTNGLYNTGMGIGVGGIARSGSSGSFTYSTITGREAKPVASVSFFDTLRFSNWLQNGQPTGVQDNTTTEDGAYTITALGIANNSITRNSGATFFLTSEDEWYKAAYFDAASTSYFNFPSGTDTQIVCALPGATPNTANCGNVVKDLTDVGSYTGSASPAGTFDQGGNLWEWNEAILGGTNRGLRGGGLADISLNLGASVRSSVSASSELDILGFRVASVPEPGPGLLLMMGLLGLAGLHRRRD